MKTYPSLAEFVYETLGSIVYEATSRLYSGEPLSAMYGYCMSLATMQVKFLSLLREAGENKPGLSYASFLLQRYPEWAGATLDGSRARPDEPAAEFIGMAYAIAAYSTMLAEFVEESTEELRLLAPCFGY